MCLCVVFTPGNVAVAAVIPASFIVVSVELYCDKTDFNSPRRGSNLCFGSLVLEVNVDNGLFVFAFVFKSNLLARDWRMKFMFVCPLPQSCVTTRTLVFSWVYWFKKIFLLLGLYKTMSDSNISQRCMIKTGETCGASTKHKGSQSNEMKWVLFFSAELFFLTVFVHIRRS